MNRVLLEAAKAVEERDSASAGVSGEKPAPEEGSSAQVSPAPREPVEQVALLMPVWGAQFVGRFLEFCLPTMLAPNNIPALAKALPCRFVLLSSEADEPVIRAHPAWRKLERICEVEIRSIDDLITQANHTATITLAFERAVRQAGHAIRRTCFMFLMSDYLVADGSFKSVLTAIQKGASCVLAGNFQIISEDAIPVLRQHFDSTSHEIVLPPRDLVRWSLAHLHPATVANIVNFGLTHNSHTNRLFWRVDEDTLIGRFYLIHPIAIHPEIDDFTIGASWDYSFVPELCPSGNAVTMTDSDDYLVVEWQRRGYESENLRAGPIDAASLAESLADWATENHRRNVRQVVTFHAAELPPNLQQVIEQSDAFLQNVRDRLQALPQSHRQHPYWVGSLAVNRLRSNRPLSQEDWKYILGDPGLTPPSNQSLLGLKARLFGFPPRVTRLHPSWPDYQLVADALDEVFSSQGSAILVTENSARFALWAAQTDGEVATLDCNQLLQLARYQYLPLTGTFDACVLILSDQTFEQADELIEHVGPLVKAGGRIIFLVFNNRSFENASELAQSFAARAHGLATPSVWLEGVQYVELSGPRLLARRVMAGTAPMTGARRVLSWLARPLAPAASLLTRRMRSGSVPPKGIWSSVYLNLRRSERSVPLPRRFGHESEIVGDPRPQKAAGSSAPNQARGPARSMAGRLWPEDPAKVGQILAGYRFVVDLFGSRHDVAEIGCASPAGTSLALQSFRRITLFDPRPPVIGDLQWYFRDEWRFEAQVHNPLVGSLPRIVDSIFSVDFIQYISRDEEDLFVGLLKNSLSRDSDFIVVGCPAAILQGTHAETSTIALAGGDTEPRCPKQPEISSSAALESELGAQNAATGRKIFRRTDAELLAPLQRHFSNVFLFSMVGETVRAGSDPKAQHYFALGCGRK
jgi:hypothetical protein